MLASRVILVNYVRAMADLFSANALTQPSPIKEQFVYQAAQARQLADDIEAAKQGVSDWRLLDSPEKLDAMRECGLEGADLDEFAWDEYEDECGRGHFQGCLDRGDNGRVYYTLGV